MPVFCRAAEIFASKILAGCANKMRWLPTIFEWGDGLAVIKEQSCKYCIKWAGS